MVHDENNEPARLRKPAPDNIFSQCESHIYTIKFGINLAFKFSNLKTFYMRLVHRYHINKK